MTYRIEQNVPLAPLTTLGVGGPASHAVTVETIEELKEVCAFAERNGLQIFVLGGGSNVVVSDAGVDALVVRLGFTDIQHRIEGSDVHVTVGAGVVLDDLIEEMVQHEWWGLENLSSVPGSVGAVPIQNVGAYGVEAKDLIQEVTIFDTRTCELKVMTNTECAFGYRDSIFKHRDGKHLIVTAVTFKLSETPSPKIGYKDLALIFGNERVPSLREIRSAVTLVRKGKFPDWRRIGTAGSFFKNPIIPAAEYTLLQERFPGMPGFALGNSVKIPLGWILDKVLNVRGYREGNVGLYENQALVLVNHGGATAEEILAFSDRIIQKVFDATSIVVEREVVTLE